jgi:superfamily I DNA/RNA helicase
MGRKKKTVEEYIPSKYQVAIYDYVENGNGNLVVEAAAGAGKTTTLVNCIKRIPSDKRILMSAFNKDIVNDLNKKTNDFENVEVRTFHGLGLRMLKIAFPYLGLGKNELKYVSHLKNNIRMYSSIDTRRLSTKDYFRYVDNICKYVDYGRFYLCKTERDLDFIESRYDLDTIKDEKEIAIQLMEWGKENIEEIDYTDMVWLPTALDVDSTDFKYDYIMIDECQDLNKAQRELVLRCVKDDTRMISVGDRNQAIYSFAGADPDSFNKLLEIPNTKCLPLSISYRCPRNVVEYARRLVPTIEPNEANREEGNVLFDVSIDEANDGDMILCRNNAPLIQVYNEFLKLGKKAYIRGKDIGANLKTAVKSTKQDNINVDCMRDGVFVRLYDDVFKTRNKIMEKYAVDAKTAMKSATIDNKLDIIKALEVLSEGLKTSKELIDKIDEIFSKDKKKEGISLSTIHKAKGLEADNIFIVCRSLMPSKSAKKDWEVTQEHNLEYVAYTRAKKKLCFVDEKEFEQFDMSSLGNQSVLSRIETQVNRVLGNTSRVVVNKSNALDIIKNATKIEKRIPTSNTISINTERRINSFSDIFKNKKLKKVKR